MLDIKTNLVFVIYRCVELDPKNLQAYITLASCYANEMLTNEALDSLRQWLANNDKYSHLLSNRRSQTTTAEPRLIDEYVNYASIRFNFICFS